MTEQQSSVIEYIAADHLKPHPFSVDIYGLSDFEDLVESIKETGIRQALYINNHNEIISGHRRWMAAKAIKTDYVCPVIRKKYIDEIDERLAIIDFNRQRVKTGPQLLKEGEGLKGIYAERARERQEATQLNGRNQENNPVFKSSVIQNFVQPNTTKPSVVEQRAQSQIAKTIGLGSGEQWRKLEIVAQKRPDLLVRINNNKPDEISIHKAYVEVKKAEQKTITASNKIELSKIEIPKDKYKTIVIDPPWPIQKIIRDVRPNQIEIDYPTMTIEEISNFPIKSLAMLEGCHIYLWTTHKFLPFAFQIFEKWGVSYECCLTWVKNVGFTPFSWMYSTEFCLFGRFGSLPLLKLGKRTDIEAKVREHSRKPDEFYEIIKEVSPEPRLDIFSREHHDGFSQYGNEVGKYN